MKTSNKVKITNLTTWIMIITISLIAVFFIGYIFTTTFDLNVFDSETSEFIFSFIGFSSVLVIFSAILNISLNIGIIADSRIHEIGEDSNSFLNKKFFLIIGLFIFSIITFLFIGDYLTRRHYKQELLNEANDIMTRYSESINKISDALVDTNKVNEIPVILNFLSNQKEKFPSVRLITSDNYDGQLTFLEINSWKLNDELKTPYYGNSFYKCEIEDCEYLKKIFTGKTTQPLLWTKEDDYKLYFPFLKQKKKFVLVFTKYERNGKIGSRK